MSEVQEGVVRKVYANTKNDKGGCSVYLEGVDGALYLDKPNKAEDFAEGDVVRYEVKKPVGKGYAVSRIRKLTADELAERQPKVEPLLPTKTTKAEAAEARKAPTHAVRAAKPDDERQRMIVVQSCQKVAIDLLKIYMEKEAFTLGAAVNKRKAVIDAFFNGLVYDLCQQVFNGPVALEGKPEDAKPAVKAKAASKGKAATVEESPTESDLAQEEGSTDGMPDLDGELEQLD